MERIDRSPAQTSRSLVPREHGAYGQLLLPLATALALRAPTTAAIALAAALVLAFVAHEPLLVLLGHRGRRAVEEDGPRARRALVLLGGGAAVLGAVGAALAPPAARLALLLPLALGGAVALLVSTRREKTLGGEVLVAAALSSGALVVGLAARAPLGLATACWATWVLAFATATLAVQVILVRARSKGRRDPGPAHALAAIVLLGAAVAAIPVLGLPPAAPLALAPTALLSITVCVLRVSPRRLRELGWAMVGSSVLTMAILIAGLR